MGKLRKKLKKHLGTAIGLATGGLVGGAAGKWLTKGSNRKERHLKQQLAAAGPQAWRQELFEEQEALRDLPERLRGGQMEAAKRAGTYAETPEWMSGLTSEVGAQSRGATFEAKRRMNALRRKLGMPEETEATMASAPLM